MRQIHSHTKQQQPTRWSRSPGMSVCAGGCGSNFEGGTGSPEQGIASESIKMLNKEEGR